MLIVSHAGHNADLYRAAFSLTVSTAYLVLVPTLPAACFVSSTASPTTALTLTLSAVAGACLLISAALFTDCAALSVAVRTACLI